jgi:hypothetical protein
MKSYDKRVWKCRSPIHHGYRHWSKINTGVLYPIGFTEENMKAHLQDAERWDEMRTFSQWFVQYDEWTTNGTMNKLSRSLRNLESRDYRA